MKTKDTFSESKDFFLQPIIKERSDDLHDVDLTLLYVTESSKWYDQIILIPHSDKVQPRDRMTLYKGTSMVKIISTVNTIDIKTCAE